MTTSKSKPAKKVPVAQPTPEPTPEVARHFEPWLDNMPVLSDRELQALIGLSKGMSNIQIAAELGLSPNTIHIHLLNLYRKLRVRSRLQAVQAARELGLLPLL